MRGGSKIVAGGQFRCKGVVAAAATKPGASAQHVVVCCSTCATLRLDLKKSRHEITHYQHTVEELQREVAKMEAMQYTLWAENATQTREIEGLRGTADQLQQSQSSKDDKIRSLELQIFSAHAEHAEPASDAEPVAYSHRSQIENSATQCSLLRGEGEFTNAIQARAMTEEVGNLRRELTAQEVAVEAISKEWQEAKNALERERTDHDATRSEFARTVEHDALKIAQTEHLLEVTRQELAQQQERTADNISCLADQFATTAGLEAKNADLQSIIASLQAQVADTKAQNAELSHEVARLSSQTQDSELANTLQTLEASRLLTEVEEHQRQHSVQQHQIQEQAASLMRFESEVEVWKKRIEHAEEAACAETTRLQQQLASCDESCERLREQLTAAEHEIAENEAFVAKLKGAHAAALTRALHAAIRLSVVAPTVNVYLSDFGASTAKSNSLVVCKPPPPRERIREVVESEILPQFTMLIVAGSEKQDDSGDGGGQGTPPIEPWVRELLQSMQAKLTQQLRGVYSGV